MNLWRNAVLLGLLANLASAAPFTHRDLFSIPFTSNRDGLGSKIEGGNFIIPRDFSIDNAGRFYIYDINKHRIARFSSSGQYELSFNYPASAGQIFAHADDKENVWLIISDPNQGIFYGVFDKTGKSLRSAIFSQYDQYQMRVDDDGTLHLVLKSTKNPGQVTNYILDEKSLLLKKQAAPPPAENHHHLRKSDKVFFVDQVPDASKDDSRHINQITDASHHPVAEIKGTVMYVSDDGHIYTRMTDRDINVYDVNGRLEGTLQLTGLPSSFNAIRFDSAGNIYQLDGLPDSSGQWSEKMPGMKMTVWQQR